MQRPLFKYLQVLLWLLCWRPALSQQTDLEKWTTLLNRPFDKIHIATQEMWDSLLLLPKESIFNLVQTLDNNPQISNSNEEKIRLALIKIRYCNINSGYYKGLTWPEIGNDAIKLATLEENDYLLQSCYNLLGDIYQKGNNNGNAIFYLMKAVAMAEALGYEKKVVISNKIATSSALYHTENYQQCIAYCNSPLDLESGFDVITPITAYNNTGLSYMKLGKPDSAIYYFKKVVNFCSRIHYGVWTGIASGNIGDVLHLEGKDAAAMPLWQMDYDSSMKYHEYGNAGLTLAYMSAYQFSQGDQKRALDQLRWAGEVNKDDAINLERICLVKYDCYRRAGLYDSAVLFLQQHYRLNDSLNRVISRNNFNTVELKLSAENTSHEFQLLKKERQAEVTRRNLLLVALASFILIGILLYNRQRLRIRLAQQQKAIAEAEKDAAKEQLQMFTQTLLEKNEQIEQLNDSLRQQVVATNDELIHQSLLTDYDWNRFKELFEKTNPGFFQRIKNAAPGITQSEMRLAALIKLNLDNKQMASMQGISVSSLRGNKTRLRQKLNISPETDLDELIRQL